jgi:maltooligosyltrehalose trehalohydrolase
MSVGAEAIGPAAVRAAWAMADGTTLTILLNLGDEAVAAPTDPLLFATGTPGAPASCAVWLS